jgi:hypothetical protein
MGVRWQRHGPIGVRAARANRTKETDLTYELTN